VELMAFLGVQGAVAPGKSGWLVARKAIQQHCSSDPRWSARTACLQA
jgi:hypothetical protein